MSYDEPIEPKPKRLGQWMCLDCGQHGHQALHVRSDALDRLTRLRGSLACPSCGSKSHLVGEP